MFVLIYDLLTKEEFKITFEEFHEFFDGKAPMPTTEIQEYDDFIYHKARFQAVYATYRGDKFEDVGTVLELYARLGLDKHVLQSMAAPSTRERAVEYRRVAIRIDNLMEE